MTTGEVAGPGTGSTGNRRPEQLSLHDPPGPPVSLREAVASAWGPDLHLHSSKMGESFLCLEVWGGRGSTVRASLVPPLFSYSQKSAPHIVLCHLPFPLPLRGRSPHRPYGPKVTPNCGPPATFPR